MVTARIEELKRRKGAVILAHYYVDEAVQDVADFVGDSLELARKAVEVSADIIVLCGVYFMAETAKILNPDKKVLIPYPLAGCLMADMALAEEVEEFKKLHPDCTVVTYVNSSARVKALSDVCCTSANAVDVVRSLKADKVLFLPDKHLGEFVAERVNRTEVLLWSGYCPVHARLTLEEVKRLKEAYPDALLAVHPECRKGVRDFADFVGSTSQIVKFVKGASAERVIVGTEIGTIHTLKKLRPDVEFIPAYSGFICDQMKLITIDRVLLSLERERFEVNVPEPVAGRARLAIERMFEVA
jgi:quinolinate synthase